MKTKKLLLLFAFIATMFTAFPAEVAQTNEIIITGSSGTPADLSVHQQLLQ